MSTPQTEDGYTKIANELLEAFSTLDASGSAWRVFMVVLRKTYGYHKKEDKISLSQFVDMSKLNHRSVCRGIGELVEKNIIQVKRGGYINIYSIQKRYELWGSVKPVTSDKNDTESSVKPVTETSDKNDTHKRKKEKKDIGEATSPEEKDLKDNSNTMGGFDKTSDDFLEEDIQVEPDYKPAGKSRPDSLRKITPQARLVFDLFGADCYKRIGVRKQEADASLFLAEAHDFETLQKAVLYLKENADNEFLPQILSPYDLRMKWAKLKDFKEKHG